VLERQRILLRVLDGADAGATCTFDERAVIGRNPNADLVLHDTKISALHCRLVASPEIVLRDLNSKNGTYLGAFRVFEGIVPLGATIQVGRTQIRVASADARVAIPLHDADEFFGLVGASPVMRALTARLARLADEPTTVLVQGETGSGKERLAEALHRAGPRRDRPLVTLDCGGLPPDLIEIELFGHEVGAYSGALESAPGAIERAEGGTLFLDEVGDLPPEMQSRLLRALDSRTVLRAGSSVEIAFDVRVVAGTRRDLALEVSRGRFREDLYDRLAPVTLHMPPLRNRLEDVPLLAFSLLRELEVDPNQHLTPDLLGKLAMHSWPGNVRELRQALERTVRLLGPLVVGVPPFADTKARLGPEQVDIRVPMRVGKQRMIEEYERVYFMALLAECQGNITHVARRAGMDRMSIYRALTRLGLDPEHDRGGR
jgi:DNA-binding NtrC family response regulator